MPTVSCHQCKASFHKTPSAVRPRNFCGPDCRYEFMRSLMSGDKNPAWKGGHRHYRGPNWTKQKRAARKRDGNHCQGCGTGRGLSVHHKRPFNLFDDYREANQLENLVTLCPVCHGRAEIQFWKDNPELANKTRVPFCLHEIPCQKCGRLFLPNSGASKVCDSCCSHVCSHCGRSFGSRKSTFRAVKYCSRACRNAAVSAHLQPIPCKACGKTFTPERPSTVHCSHGCFMTTGNPRRAFFAGRKPAARESNPS